MKQNDDIKNVRIFLQSYWTLEMSFIWKNLKLLRTKGKKKNL